MGWKNENGLFHFSEPLLELKPCIHPTVMKDMCAECGADLRKDDVLNTTASVPMVHSIPDLKVSEEVRSSKIMILQILINIIAACSEIRKVGW